MVTRVGGPGAASASDHASFTCAVALAPVFPLSRRLVENRLKPASVVSCDNLLYVKRHSPPAVFSRSTRRVSDQNTLEAIDGVSCRPQRAHEQCFRREAILSACCGSMSSSDVTLTARGGEGSAPCSPTRPAAAPPPSPTRRGKSKSRALLAGGRGFSSRTNSLRDTKVRPAAVVAAPASILLACPADIAQLPAQSPHALIIAGTACSLPSPHLTMLPSKTQTS